MGRRRPRPIGEALGRVQSGLTPPGLLAAVQICWSETVGEAIAEVTAPVKEREGTVTVHCSDAVWVEELTLIKPDILARLRERFGDGAPTDLRFLLGEIQR